MPRSRGFSQNFFYRVVFIAIGSLLLGFILAACGSTTTTGGQPASTPTKTVNCGSVHSSAVGIVPSDKASAQKAENCFYQAYQQCRPATLTFTTFEVDTGDIHNFSVKSANGSCAISDGVQHYIAPNPAGAATIYSCATMQLEADGLHIQTCGDLGTVLVPLS
jgi:hypothetical protein